LSSLNLRDRELRSWRDFVAPPSWRRFWGKGKEAGWKPTLQNAEKPRRLRVIASRPCEQVTAWFHNSLRLLRRFAAEAKIEAERKSIR
jgi:hypothetical protein